MSKTSKTLRGSAIVGLSALAFTAAGATSAFAVTTPTATSITITPTTQTGNTTTGGGAEDCLGYTATVTPAPTSGSINVSVTQPLNSTGTVTFCVPSTPAGGSAGTNDTVTTNGTGQTVTTETFDATGGTVIFGVEDDTAETDSIQAFNGDTTFTAGEANGTATAIFVNNTGDQSVKSLSVSPTTAKARPGDRIHFIVTALNGNSAVPAAAQGVNGAQVYYSVTGPDAQGPTACGGGTTGSDGTVHCGVTLSGSPTGSGTDTVTFFVNNATNSGPGADTGDTQTTATINNIGASPAGDTVVASCGDNGYAPNNTRNCTDTIDNTNPANSQPAQQTFEFDILDPATNPECAGGGSFPTNHSDDCGAQTPITFSIAGASSAASLSAPSDSCYTDYYVENSQGYCPVYVTVTEPSPTVGEVITVTGTLTGTTVSDASTLAFVADPATARNITLTPATQNVATGHSGILTATVTDAAGNPVADVDVDFVSTGAGAFTTGCFLSATCTTVESGGFLGAGLPGTDANGQVQVQVGSGTAGTETVSATIDPDNDSQCGDPAGYVNGLPTTGVAAGNCSATATVNYAAATTHRTSETPSLKAHKHGHTVTLVAKTHPSLKHKTMHFYIVKHGVNHLVGSHGTGSSGTAHGKIHLKKGHYTLIARVVHAGHSVNSHFSKKVHITIK